MIYCYMVVRENLVNGIRKGKPVRYYSNVPLKVSGLYVHLRDLKGAYRILEEAEVIDE